jgi:hypothetical protein
MATIPIVDTIDKRKGAIAATVVMLLLLIYLLLTTFEMADPPPKDPVLKTETVIPDELILKELKVEGGAGSGSPSDDPIDDPKPVTQEIITKTSNPDTKVNTGKGKTTTTENSKETSTTKEQSNDPFAPGGKGGENGGGEGDKFGKDSGNGKDGKTGSGNGEGRIRIKDPSIPDLKSNVDVVIHLKLTIDAQGNVVSAQNIAAKTTTTDQILINKVIHEVKKQVKYNKEPGAALANVYMPVNIKAQ